MFPTVITYFELFYKKRAIIYIELVIANQEVR